MSRLFSKSKARAVGFEQLNNLVTSIQRQLQLAGPTSQDVAKAAISMESLSPGMSQELESSVDSLRAALESVAADNQISQHLTQAQVDAGITAGIVAGNVGAFLTQEKPSGAALESMNVIANPPSLTGGEAMDRMRVALEAYDETENRNAAAYSIAYNMQAARQDEFGEAFFPTIVVTPDQVGITISIRVVTVYDEVRRQISGDLDNFGRRNIIEAVIDPTILRNDQTDIIPVVRPESEKYFVDPALVAPYTTLLDKEPKSCSTDAT